MIKYVVISILVCAIFLFSDRNVYGQTQEDSRKTVAVLQAEGKSVSDDIKTGITGGLEEGIFRSGKYKLLARGESYQKAVAAIKSDLVEGTVSDDQLIQLGHATGADFVCYATVNKYSDNLYRIAYKMIDVASSEIVNIGSETVRMGIDGLLTATDNIAKKLFVGTSSTVSAPVSTPAPSPVSTPAPTPSSKPASTTASRPVNNISPIVRSVMELINTDLGSKANRYRTDEERFDKAGSGGKIEDLIKFSAKAVFAPPSLGDNQVSFFCAGYEGKGKNDLVFLFMDGKMIAVSTVLNGFAAIVTDNGSSHLMTVWRNSSKIYSTTVDFSQKKEYKFVWNDKNIQIK